MTGMDYREEYDESYIKELLERLTKLGAKITVLTGVSLAEGRIGAAALEPGGEILYFDDEFIPGMWHGAGDVFASALVGGCLRGEGLRASLRRAVDFTARCIRRTRDAGTDERLGLQFEPELRRLLNGEDRP